MLDYDAIVIGGGPAGTHTAMSIAKHCSQNLRILLIDRNPRPNFGKKTLSGWSCGDAVSKRSVEYVQSHLGIKYGYPELEHYVKGVVAYSPNHQTKVLFEGEGYVLNRKVWPQKQAEYLEKFNIEVMYQAAAQRLISDDGFVSGVEGKGPDGSMFKLRAKVVVDASGSASILRTNLPIRSYIEREIDRDDMESTGRYILEFEPATQDETYFDPDYCLIHLDQYLGPGGYCLAPDTPIVCKNSLKVVQEVKLGDEVLTSMGWMPVSGASFRQFTGNLVVATPFMLNQPIGLTPEHLVRTWNPKMGETWKRAEDLIRSVRGSKRNGDYLVVPLPQPPAKPLKFIDALDYVEGIVEGGYVYVKIKRSFFNGRAPNGSYRRKVCFAKHPKKTRIHVRVPLNEEFLELCGWYVSEGCIKRGHVTVSNTDSTFTERVFRLTQKLGYNSLIWRDLRPSRRKPVYNVETTNSLLGALMGECFGIGARNKKLPHWVHELPREGKLAILRGMYLGDGSIEHPKGGRSDKRVYSTSSRALAIDLWLLLASIGVIASIKRNKKKNSWGVILSGHQASFLGENLSLAKRKQNIGFVLGDGKVYLGIRKLKRSWYSGPVYDLNSAGDFTPLFNVHNCWAFPKGPNKVNIGLGVQKRALQRRNGRFREKDNLKSLIDRYVETNTVIKNARPANGPLDEGNTYNTWQVPVRRQNDCLVANGYAIVGDAAWMPRPIDAGGIGPALYASIILGRVVAEAIEANDTSEEGLWKYNLEYMAGYGSQMASFEILRRFLQNTTNEEINYGMKHFLTYEDVEKITLREHPGFGKVKLLNPLMLVRVMSHWRLASGLRYCVHKHHSLVELYSEYPKKSSMFPEWHKRFLTELSEAYMRFP